MVDAVTSVHTPSPALTFPQPFGITLPIRLNRPNARAVLSFLALRLQFTRICREEGHGG
ncbi:MAG: hypothetical protein O9352_16650 [Rhizobium sp.]|jgi:hypothetical protein|nr:hypothetical protein [Rhizobium sp.]